jgi:hypothetical protein
MRLQIALALLLSAATALAQDSRHLQLAKEFDRIAVDQEAAIAEIVEQTIEQQPSLASNRKELADQLREFSSRPEVIAARVKIYVQDFTEVELEQVLSAIKSPGYKILQAKAFQVRNPFYASLIKFTPVIPRKP